MEPHQSSSISPFCAVTTTDDALASGGTTMPVRVYRTASTALPVPLVFHLHGGAFDKGSLESGRTICELLASAGAVVVSADYPLAPRHPFPQALEAAYGALCALHKCRAKWAQKRSLMFVAGEEAGGNLAAGLALMARDQQSPPIAGQILISPMLDPCMGTRSLRQAEAGTAGCQWAKGWLGYLGSPANAEHPYASPLRSSRLAGVAPALVLTADDDPLRDESVTYARRLRESGVAVERHVLSAPTGWPCTFGRPVGANESWGTTVRNCFRSFFIETLGALSPPSLQLKHI